MWRFMTVFAIVCHWIPSWASWIQSTHTHCSPIIYFNIFPFMYSGLILRLYIQNAIHISCFACMHYITTHIVLVWGHTDNWADSLKYVLYCFEILVCIDILRKHAFWFLCIYLNVPTMHGNIARNLSGTKLLNHVFMWMNTCKLTSVTSTQEQFSYLSSVAMIITAAKRNLRVKYKMDVFQF
jgi:hypothetical protein